MRRQKSCSGNYPGVHDFFSSIFTKYIDILINKLYVVDT